MYNFRSRNMVRFITDSKWGDLMFELKSSFPNLKDQDFSSMKHNVESLLKELKIKTGRPEQELKSIIENKLEYISSKRLS